MDKDKVIQLIERELVQADESTSQQDFEKHMYAIHTITALYTSSATDKMSMGKSKGNDFTHTEVSTANKSMSDNYNKSGYDNVTIEEIRAMGGKVSNMETAKSQPTNTNSISNSNLMTTDDEIGNGESIFDF